MKRECSELSKANHPFKKEMLVQWRVGLVLHGRRWPPDQKKPVSTFRFGGGVFWFEFLLFRRTPAGHCEVADTAGVPRPVAFVPRRLGLPRMAV